jgi:hypothetical protein
MLCVFSWEVKMSLLKKRGNGDLTQTIILR